MVIIAINALATGDITGLTYGADYMGNRCGTGDLADRPKLWFPRLSHDLGEQYGIAQSHPWEIALYGLCVAECPTSPHTVIADYGNDKAAFPRARPKAQQWTAEMPTFSTLNRCVPRVDTNHSVLAVCTEPRCASVGKPCRDLTLLGLPADAWEIRNVGEGADCLREVELHQTAVTRQPNAGPFLEYLLAVAASVEQAVTCVTAMCNRHVTAV